MAIKYILADSEKEKAEKLSSMLNKTYDIPIREKNEEKQQNTFANNQKDDFYDQDIRKRALPIAMNVAQAIASKKKKDNRKWFEPGAFNDGYQFGDLTKTVTGSLADATGDFVTGLAGIGEGTQDTGAYLVGLKAKWEADYLESKLKDPKSKNLTEEQRKDLLTRYLANRDVSQQMKDFIQKDLRTEANINEKAANGTIFGGTNNLLNGRPININGTDTSNYFEMDSALGEKSDSLVQSAGQLAGQMGLQAVGVPWWVTSGVTSFGGATQEAFNNGASYEQAGAYGLIDAGGEILSEKISGGISFGGKTLDEGLKKSLAKDISNRTLRTMISFGFDATGEGAEEIFSDVVSNIGKKLTYAKDGTWEEILSSPEKMDKWIGETIYDLIGPEARAQYDESFKGGFALSGGANTVRAANSIRTGTDYDTGATAQDIEAQKYIQEAEKIINQENASKNQNNTQKQQTISQENKMAQNQNTEQIQPSLPTRALTYEESARKYNIDTNNETVKAINRVASQRGIQTRYDAEMFKSNDTNALWRTIKDQNGNVVREVILNPNSNSNKTLQNIMVHELTHDFEGTDEYNQLSKIILEYDKGNTGYNKAWTALEELYSKVYDKNSSEFQTLVDSEAVADILGNKLGDQEFINNLSVQEPSLSRKIYNWVVDKLNKLNRFTGYSNEKIFWADVKNKFENAYRQDYQGNNANSKFSIKTDSKGNKYVKIDTSQDIFEGKTSAEQAKIAKEYILNNFRQNGLIKNNENINVTRRTANEYTHPSKSLPSNMYSSKLKSSTELDNLLETSQYIKSEPDDGRHIFAKNGWDYYETTFQVGDKVYTGLLNIAKGDKGKLLYDITNIKERTGNYSVKTVSDTSSSINNSISSSNENVNTTKYSIQKAENNSDSLNLPKVKKGYIRLFRGLENEYNSKYDKSKLDNVNGYESWTDNYDLAKAYGDNVYYIDIPTNEIKNSVIDENSDSETYGDRNLIYKNDKPVGIKGQSGNEYMLYMDHDNYSSIQYNKIQNNSVLDNQGRKLSKEQQEYFKDSKVRDENGNLLTMYHGTPNGNYNEFKEGSYFTSNKEYADGYQNTWASAISTKQDNSNPKTYEVYLNITTPFSIQDKRAKKIYIDEYVKGGNSLYLDPYSDYTDYINNLEELDWTEGEDLRDWLKENHPEYDGLILDEGGNGGYGEAEYSWRGKSYVPFNANQIKNVDNINPTSNPDIRYSKSDNTWQSYLDQNYKNTGKGQTIQEVKLPKADKTIQDVGLPIENTTVNQDTNQTTEKADVLPVTPEQKARKHYKSIIESSNTTPEAKAIAKELMGLDTYEPDSNKSQLERADAYIEQYGVDKALERLVNNVETDSVTFDRLFKRVGVDDVALGERLIQYYSKTGDAANLQNAIQLTAAAGTDAGRAVQAFSILNHQTPTGQVTWIQRTVDKVNKELKQKRGENAPQFEFTPEMQQKILNTTTQEEMFDAINEVYDELGQQVSKSTMEKIDSWRYFSMLANPKTHIRNIVGNIAMGGMQSVKNKVAGAIEDVVARNNPEMERTHTLKRASQEVKEFAKNDLKNLEVKTSLDMNSNKYNPKTRLENSMRTFKSDALENTLGKLFDINDKALEVEDAWGLKAAYAKSLAEYMTANNLSPDTITDSQLAKARKYATEQAKEATFHQANALASALNQFSKKNKLTKFATDAILPFKKTPANIAKAGVEYSPVGLVKSAIYDSVQLRKGNISVNKYIDNISKGLTGTGVTLLGYALASAGVLKASGGDDKDKEKYDQDRGNQTYSLQIGDNTYSLDWLAPTGIPLFIGAEIYELKQQEDKTKSSSSDDESSYNQAIKSAENIFNSFAHAVDPMTEMSMLSGLTSTLRSYDENLLAGIVVNTGKSYVGQFVPTAVGQIAKTTDQYERNTTSTKTGTLPKAIDSTKNQIMAKIPGLRQQLPVKNDIWGNEIKQSENIVERALENSVFPYTQKTVSNTNVDKALTKLYEETGESSVIPDVLDKTFTIDGQKYRMTNEEYAEYRKNYGTTSYNLINDLVKTKEYEKLTTEQKQKAIENIYSYAKESNKIDYANKNNLSVKSSTLYDTMEDLKKNDGKQSEYINYLAKTNGMIKETEKNKTLLDSNYTDKTKEIIYSNGTGKDDSLYDIMSNTGINIDEYLKYKTQEFASDKEDDGTTTGKTVSGSKKTKVYNYVNNMNISYNQKLLLLGTQYSLTDNEQTTLANYVNSLNISKNEKLQIYEKLKGFTVYQNGTVKW